MACKPLPFAASGGKPSPTAPIQGIPTTAIDFDDILAQSFGPLDALSSIAKRLGDSECACGGDVLHLGYVIEALHNYGTTRFMELLTQAEKSAVRQGVAHV